MKTNRRIPDWIIGIGLTVFLVLITTTGALDFTARLEILKELAHKYEQSGLTRSSVGKRFHSDLREAINSLDHDTMLANSIRRAGNVVLPIYFDVTSQVKDRQIPEFVNTFAYKNVKGRDQQWAVSSMLWLSKIKPIFSLGVVLFELLTGEKPFKAGDMTSLMYKIAQEPHPSLKTINPRIPTVVEKIIDKALEKELDKRYQSASQMAEQLRAVVAKMDEITRQQRPTKTN